MRNQLFILTVLAGFWTGRGDQRIPDEVNRGDFYMDDSMSSETGSGSYAFDDGDDEDSSSFSSYTPPSLAAFEDDVTDDDITDDDISDGSGETKILRCSMSLIKEFKNAYYDSQSEPYGLLEDRFTTAVEETFHHSPLKENLFSTHVINFSPGSVRVNYQLDIISFSHNLSFLEQSAREILADGLTKGRFESLNANASSSLVNAVTAEPIMTTTESQNTEVNGKTTKKGNDKNKDDDRYRPRGGDTAVEIKENNIFDLILGDPIIIAVIVGGLIVILLIVILVFLFVVYRLKKKDEGSYSLDEPAKSKDPTAYWKETKEFYA